MIIDHLNQQSLLLWILLIAVFILCLLWHIRENRHLVRECKEKMDEKTALLVKRFAWSRTIQLLVALGSTSIVILIYDWQLNYKTDAAQQAAIARGDMLPKDAVQAFNASIAEQPQPQSQNPFDAAINGTDILRPLPAESPAVAIQEPTAETSNQSQTAQDIVDKAAATTPTLDDIYNPEKKAGDPQSNMDDIKKRYEDIMVIYMFLKKCGRTKDGDYNIITSALAQEMAAVNAPGRMQYDVLTAAQGSYKELYAKSSCSSSGIDSLNAQYTDYIGVLSRSFPPQ